MSEPTKNIASRLVSILVIILIIIWLINKAHDNYINGEKKPFWTGTQQMQVCKQPYYSSSDCYKLNVKLLDEKQAQISFPNGYLVVSDLVCYFAARVNDSPRYVFCRSWDNQGEQWDFIPTWVNYE
jgi:hypothetical protein